MDMDGIGIWQLLIILTLIFIPLLVFGPIAKKAGYSVWWGVVMIIPFVNLIGIWVFAFVTWPVENNALSHAISGSGSNKQVTNNAENTTGNQAGILKPLLAVTTIIIVLIMLFREGYDEYSLSTKTTWHHQNKAIRRLVTLTQPNL